MNERISISAEKKEVVNRVADHMQFLGYETKISETDPYVIGAVHPHNVNVIISVSSIHVSFSSRFTTNDFARTNRIGFLEFLNSLNKQSSAIQYISDNDQGTLNLHICLLAPYEKVLFGRFVQLWENDLKLLKNDEETPRFLK